MAKLKIQGFVLLESMFSMVIIMMCFMIAMSTFVMMNSSPDRNQSVKARIALQTQAQQCKIQDRLIDEDMTGKDFTIKRRIIANENHRELITLLLTAVNKEGKVIAEYNEYLLAR